MTALPLLTRILGGASLVVIAGLSIALMVSKGETRHWHKVADQNESKWHAEANAHALTVANYRAAASEAQRRNDAQVAMIESRNEAIGKEANATLNHALAELDRLSRAGQLRPGGAHRSNPGRANGGEAGQAASAAGRAADPAGLYLSSSDVLRAAQNEARHDALIDYVEGLAAQPANQQTAATPGIPPAEASHAPTR